MARKKQDVKQEVASSTTSEVEGVNNPGVNPGANPGVNPEINPEVPPVQEELTPEVGEPQAQEQPQEQLQGQPQFEAVDERGVPWKNVAMEWKRKTEDLAEKLPQIIEEKLTQHLSAQQQKPQYTIAELEAFALQNPEYAGWARQEIAKLQKEEFAKIVDERLTAQEKKRREEFQRQKAFEYVMANYPQCFVKDSQGRPIGWDANNPLTREIGNLMQDERLKSQPDALMIAADIAYARLARNQGLKQKTLQAQVKNLQKKTLIEGGGATPASSAPPIKQHIERLKQTGSAKDAEAAVKEYFRHLGVISE